MGRLRELAKAETSYIWSGLANTIFPASPICYLQSGWISSTKTFIIIISMKFFMISLKIYVANFQTSPKLRIPQGWACSGGIGPNLFEEEIGKCENHKFPIKLPPPSVKFVTFNICWCSAVRLNLVPFSQFTCKQRSSLQSNIFWQIKTKKQQWHKIFDRKSVFPEKQKFWQVTWLRWINIKMISDVSESFPPWVFWSELGCAEIEKLLDPKFIARAQLRDTQDQNLQITITLNLKYLKSYSFSWGCLFWESLKFGWVGWVLRWIMTSLK